MFLTRLHVFSHHAKHQDFRTLKHNHKMYIPWNHRKGGLGGTSGDHLVHPLAQGRIILVKTILIKSMSNMFLIMSGPYPHMQLLGIITSNNRPEISKTSFNFATGKAGR